jgi:hypothetical protein
MSGASPTKILESYSRINFDEVPEGWKNLALELFERIDDYCENHEFNSEVIREWYISGIDLNRNGKLVLKGKHIFRFTDIIKDIAFMAENVCCICGNAGEIVDTYNEIKLPLCHKHQLIACSNP